MSSTEDITAPNSNLNSTETFNGAFLPEIRTGTTGKTNNDESKSVSPVVVAGADDGDKQHHGYPSSTTSPHATPVTSDAHSNQQSPYIAQNATPNSQPQHNPHSSISLNYQPPPFYYRHEQTSRGPPPIGNGVVYNDQSVQLGGNANNLFPPYNEVQSMYNYPFQQQRHYMNMSGNESNINMPQAAFAAKEDHHVATTTLEEAKEESKGSKSSPQQDKKSTKNHEPSAGNSQVQPPVVGSSKSEVRDDDLEVAKACLNLRHDGKQQQQREQNHPPLYPQNDPRYNYYYNQMPYQQQQYPPYPPYQSNVYMNTPHRGLGQEGQYYHQGYFPPYFGYGGSAGMGPDSVNGCYFPSMHHPGDFSRPPMPGFSTSDSSFGHSQQGTKRPFDQQHEDQESDKRVKVSPSPEIPMPMKKATAQKVKKGKRPSGMPRRPLSAYNFFFSAERERVLAEIPDPDGKTDEKNNDSTTNSIADDTDATSATSEKSDVKTDETVKENTERLLALRESINSSKRRPHRKTHGKIGFKDLAKLIGERWRALTADDRKHYTGLAEKDLGRYKEQMKEYHKKNKWSFIGDARQESPVSVKHEYA